MLNAPRLTALMLGLGLAVSATLATAQSFDSPEARAYVDALLAKMTLEEKIGQLNLVSVGPDYPKEAIMADIRAGKVGAMFNTVTRPDIRQMQDQVVHSRLKIPLFYAYDVIHGMRTIFPIDLGLASTWNLDAIATSGRISAIEAAADGLNLTFSPTVDVTREPRWGRASETFGEDTWLTSRIGATLVRAYQGNDLSAPDSLMACVKHFGGYGAVEAGRDYSNVDMSPQRLLQDYLPPYRAAVEAGAGSVMVALNSINGVPATANRWLLQDLLRKDWHFQGLVISDHGAINELVMHGVAQDTRQAAFKAFKAGVELNMHDDVYGKQLPALLAAGKVTQAEIDQATRDVLLTKYRMGLFQDPYRRLQGPDPVDTNAESRLHRTEARQVARESLVLLKNEKAVLPLRKGATLAVVGPLADSPRDVMGNWSAAGVAAQAVSIRRGLENAVAGNGKVLYAKGANLLADRDVLAYLNSYEPSVAVDERRPAELIAEAVAAARQADVVVAVVGESQGMAHEASSRARISVPDTQRDLIKALKATGKPLVLVLMNGRPLALEWEQEQADALLEAWFPGTEGGNAVADVLFGDYNPSGKLTMTFPREVGQVPLYYNHLSSGRPFDAAKPNKYTSRYFDIVNGPLYPFGYGLSYTTFDVSAPQLSSATLKQGDTLTAKVTVKNTGTRAGATVVQLYLHDVTASLARPVKELKGFQKVMLQPGESRELDFPITEADLRFYDNDLKLVSEPGEFKVMVGLDSERVREGSFTLL
ncbi:beta-glucosidase BglX [Pseudomonas oryzihabitans]|uniref:beta-glucosidase BglX n=1 Tax=Pseudomonas oryzihabitans TaxID=47885 RepID=UPI00285907FD|nr:beta-glucosidase BglX [Pseudomonas psychrotolerans]MDR6679316.1 beta-glucosidase [Pseudomonas psychrotolerans]